ncbi:hypothetical protein [Pseudarthrobacter cellobiosi]|uniref:hypothetical protein n=1 Tax=Pseudarthrobacter cellobiosi TaxID=2953654 RepID=UPI0035AC26EB
MPCGGALGGRYGLAADRRPLRGPRTAGPSPVIELNRAVAVATPSGPEHGLELVEALASRGELAGSHLLPAVRGELLTRLGRHDDARSALLPALALCGNAAERAVLQRKVDELS